MSIIDALNPESIAAKVGVLAVACAAVFAIGHHVGYKGEKAVYDVYVAKQAAIAEKQVADNAKGLADNKAQYDANLANIQKDRDAKIKSLQGEYDSAIADRNKSDDRLRKYLSRTGIPSLKCPALPAAPEGLQQKDKVTVDFLTGYQALIGTSSSDSTSPTKTP